MLPLCLPDAQFAQPVSLTSDLAHAKLAEGVPLLRDESLVIDRKDLSERWLEICKIVARHQEGNAAQNLGEAMRRGRLDAQELTDAVLSGKQESLLRTCESHDLDPSLAATVLRMTLFPLLTSINLTLLPLREGSGWQKGYCPTCGSWPLLGEFRGLDQTRFLRLRPVRRPTGKLPGSFVRSVAHAITII